MNACATCAHAAEHGWFGSSHVGTHCGGCHRSWVSRKEAHCRRCHEHFSTPNNFDLHLGSHGCVPPAEVATKDGAPKLRLVERKSSGAVWVGAAERDWEAA